MFRQATGWLGWSPDQALDTPLPLIELALEGRVDFIIKTNPFGSGDKQDKPPGPVMKDDDVATGLFGMLKGYVPPGG